MPQREYVYKLIKFGLEFYQFPGICYLRFMIAFNVKAGKPNQSTNVSWDNDGTVGKLVTVRLLWKKSRNDTKTAA